MIGPSALLFRLRRRIENGPTTISAADRALVEATAEGRLFLQEDLENGTYTYLLDGQEVSKKLVQRVSWYLNLISSPDRGYKQRESFTEPMTLAARGADLLYGTEASAEPLLVYGYGDRSYSCLYAAFSRSDSKHQERFIAELTQEPFTVYDEGPVPVKQAIIQVTGFKTKQGDWKVKLWDVDDPQGKPRKARVREEQLVSLFTLPLESGEASYSEQLRSVMFLAVEDEQGYCGWKPDHNSLPATLDNIQRLKREGIHFAVREFPSASASLKLDDMVAA